MPKGRKPSPTALKKIRGTDQPCRTNKNEVTGEPLIKIPSAPRWFTKTARKIYRAKGAQLKNLRLLTVLDVELFVSFCREYANYLDTSSELDNYSTVKMLSKLDLSNVDIENKQDVIDCLMAGEDKILARLRKTNKESWERAKALASEFGFTPSARVKMIMPSAEDDTDLDFD